MTVDLIDSILGVRPGDALDTIRAARPAARENAQASYDALFTDIDEAAVSRTERHAVGYWTAALSGSQALAAHHQLALAELDAALAEALAVEALAARTSGPTGSDPAGPLSVEDEPSVVWTASDALAQVATARLIAALEHTHLLTFRPRDANPDALQRLLDAGWSTTAIVSLSQLVSFTHFQLRVIAGLAVLKQEI